MGEIRNWYKTVGVGREGGVGEECKVKRPEIRGRAPTT